MQYYYTYYMVNVALIDANGKSWHFLTERTEYRLYVLPFTIVKVVIV